MKRVWGLGFSVRCYASLWIRTGLGFAWRFTAVLAVLAAWGL